MLLGRNGSGKSTILDLVAGLLHPDHGSISYGGVALHSVKPNEVARLGIGYLMQGGVTFPKLISGGELGICAKPRSLNEAQTLVGCCTPSISPAVASFKKEGGLAFRW